MNKKMLPMIVLLIAGLGVGFFSGVKYEQGKAPTGQNLATGQGQSGRGNGGPGGGNRRNGGGFANGEILSKDDKSITIKLRDGGSKIVFYSPSTAIGKTTDGTADDLIIGKQVVINGSTNADGSVTAQNIQVRPAGAMPFNGNATSTPNKQ